MVVHVVLLAAPAVGGFLLHAFKFSILLWPFNLTLPLLRDLPRVCATLRGAASLYAAELRASLGGRRRGRRRRSWTVSISPSAACGDGQRNGSSTTPCLPSSTSPTDAAALPRWLHAGAVRFRRCSAWMETLVQNFLWIMYIGVPFFIFIFSCICRLQ